MKAYTVAELIDALRDFDPDSEVRFAYNSKNYARIEVAAKVRNVDDGQVVYSEYHQMDRVVDEFDESDYRPAQPTDVVVLSS